jgi:signal transduction histidine kinase/predicted hydrocarbon binding protein
MAERGMSPRPRSDPGNKRIATTFLESLAVRGQAAAGQRAMRALGLGEGGLAETKAWLPDDVLGRMFIAADTDPSFARSVGHRLMAPDASGFSLYRLGLATPEKAYRRVQSLLPRESAASFWTVGEIGSGSARIEYHDRPVGDAEAHTEKPGVGSERGGAALCALRVGMLEAVPGLFGLLPARVKESTCLSKGADACRYEIHWARHATLGLWTGVAVGLALALGSFVAAFALGPSVLPVSLGAFLGVTSLGLAASVGRTVDLHRQLEAVAGARRGHLALLDQVDDALASKLDALARADAKLEGDEFSYRYRADRSLPDSDADSLGTAPTSGEVRTAAEKIHTAAGDLECWFEDGAAAETETGRAGLDEAREFVREIRSRAAKITEDGASEGLRSGDPVDLVALLARSIAAARPRLPRSTIIRLEHDDDLGPIVCEPVQIEQVVVQLLCNAVEASRGLSESPEVLVSLRKMAGGIELAVEDRGVGVESSELDEVFDPFFEHRRAGFDEGFGLPVCLRIVERHGGEFRIESEDRPGTRVSILLPAAVESGR